MDTEAQLGAGVDPGQQGVAEKPFMCAGPISTHACHLEGPRPSYVTGCGAIDSALVPRTNISR
jgi:hypothetical protein